MTKSIKYDVLKIIEECNSISSKDKMELMDKVLIAFNFYSEPISKVIWVPIRAISPNDYNPNKMAVPEKRLLQRSMLDHGVTQPLVVGPKQDEKYILIDGYHRWSIINKSKELKERLNNCVPVVVLNVSSRKQLVATIRHNRARGRHQIEEISDVVKTLSDSGWSSTKIMDALGMEADEVLRLKQFRGLGELFKDDDYSISWH